MGNLIGFAALTSSIINGQRLLRMGLTSAGVIGSRTLCLGSRNVAIADDGSYGYLCVFNDSTAITGNQTTTINGLRYSVANSGESFCIVGDSQADIVPVNSIVLGDVPIAVNANGDLIFFDATASITIDEEDTITIGDRVLRVVRTGANWYLGVSV